MCSTGKAPDVRPCPSGAFACPDDAGFAQKEALAERELISQGNVHPSG
jgi:hypothetical protein